MYHNLEVLTERIIFWRQRRNIVCTELALSTPTHFFAKLNKLTVYTLKLVTMFSTLKSITVRVQGFKLITVNTCTSEWTTLLYPTICVPDKQFHLNSLGKLLHSFYWCCNLSDAWTCCSNFSWMMSTLKTKWRWES